MARKRTAAKPQSKKKTEAKTAAPKKKVRATSQPTPRVLSPRGRGADSAGQSGDLQGLSWKEHADSESVDELLEEGNAFEAEAVQGVEDAGDEEEREVHTHEVPEDDVPEEYLDQD